MNDANIFALQIKIGREWSCWSSIGKNPEDMILTWPILRLHDVFLAFRFPNITCSLPRRCGWSLVVWVGLISDQETTDLRLFSVGSIPRSRILGCDDEAKIELVGLRITTLLLLLIWQGQLLQCLTPPSHGLVDPPKLCRGTGVDDQSCAFPPWSERVQACGLKTRQNQVCTINPMNFTIQICYVGG